MGKKSLIFFIMFSMWASAVWAADTETNQLLNLLLKKGVVTEEEASGIRADLEARKEKEPPLIGAGSEGFYIKSADGNFMLKFRGLVNLDGRFFLESNEQSPASDQFLLRRARGYFEGTLYRYFNFRVMPEFGQAKSELYDAYVDITYFPQANLKMGRFTTPAGLTFIQPDPDGNFIERSLVTNLLPFRDIGVQVHGDLAKTTVSYAVGIFNGAPDGGNSDADTNDNKEFYGRIFTHPFKQNAINSLKGLGIGISATYGNPKGSSGSTNLPSSLKTQSQERFFSYNTGVVAKGRHQRLSPQAYYYWNSFGALAEYVSSSQGVSLNGREERLNNNAWQISTTYFLTGEKNAFRGGITPLGTWGALEIAARIARLKIDNDAYPVYANANSSANKVSEYTLGLNWYLNKNVRFMIDYGEAIFKGGNVNSGNRNNEKLVLSRFQLSF